MSVRKTDPVDAAVGQRIRMQRHAVGLTQTDLAHKLGVTYQQIQKYEKGQNRLSAGRLTKVAQILGVPVVDFLADKDGPKPAQAEAAASPLELLAGRGALPLLRAYCAIKDSKLRRLILHAVENIAGVRR